MKAQLNNRRENPWNYPKDFMSPKKKKTIEQILQISVHTDMKSTEEAIFQQKTPKSIHLWSNQFWNPIKNVSVKQQYEYTLF